MQDHSLLFCHQQSEVAMEEPFEEKGGITPKGGMVIEKERKRKEHQLQILFFFFVVCSLFIFSIELFVTYR